MATAAPAAGMPIFEAGVPVAVAKQSQEQQPGATQWEQEMAKLTD